MDKWIGKLGIFFVVLGVIGAILYLNGIDWTAYGTAKKLVDNGNINYAPQVSLYQTMINNAIISTISGVAIGALFIGIGTIIDLGHERNELIRKQSEKIGNVS